MGGVTARLASGNAHKLDELRAALPGWTLALLEGVEGEGRRARYVCELVALSPAQDEFRGTGTLEGRIAAEPRGDEGFGYDPVFVPDGAERTVAELGNAWKREHSHRAR